MTKEEERAAEVKRTIEYVASIRQSEFGHSINEKRLILLADEVLRLQREAREGRAGRRR